MNRFREIAERNKARAAERRRERQERIEKTRTWRKERPRPLRDLLDSLAKVLMWSAILLLIWYIGPLLKLLKMKLYLV